MKRIFVILTGAVILLSVSCGKKSKKDPLDSAWALFEDGEYANAYTAFTALVNDEGAAAVEGQGWSALRQDLMTQAEQHFSSIAGDSLPDAYAGWVAAGWEQENYSQVVSRAQFVLRKQPQYIFVHDATITDKDVRLHEAFGHFYLGNYTACNTAISQLDATWTATSNPDALLAKLESLFNAFK